MRWSLAAVMTPAPNVVTGLKVHDYSEVDIQVI